ncbi:MAG: hypothetical protein EAX87_12740 [Candidatus Thorarchaeota archaeon]|nr:hypothetical protein [Candidatus Thorarchaeota archaeon]
MTTVTLGLLAITIWTGGISNTITSQTWQSATDTFQYITDSPLEGQMTISVMNQMYESVPTEVAFNISLTVPGTVAMGLIIKKVSLVLTPLDPENRTEFEIPTEIGRTSTNLEIENTTCVNLAGTADIRPVIITGDVYLGCGVDYILSNDSLSEPLEYGINSWFGLDGSLFMIPVTVYPSFLQFQGWSYAFIGTLLLWGLVVLDKFRKG